MRRSIYFALTVVVAATTLVPTSAQVRPVYDMGAAGLMQSSAPSDDRERAAHRRPSRRRGLGVHGQDRARRPCARSAYLSLNRGEGGQNIIGTELFDALGVIRTEELLQARALDGGEQFFTRTFDYGFSKTLERGAGASGTTARCSATWCASSARTGRSSSTRGSAARRPTVTASIRWPAI